MNNGILGGSLTRLLTAVSHAVFITNTGVPEGLADLAAATSATAVTTYEASHSG